jgi:hypothetical protein
MRETSALMFARILAATVLLVCIAIAVQMLLPGALRRRVDAGLRRLRWWVVEGWRAVVCWRLRSGHKKAAEAEAEAAIRRARKGSRIVDGEWDGNVYRPKRFDGKNDRRDKRNLH